MESSLKSGQSGLYFDWAPNTQSYLPHIQTVPTASDPMVALSKMLSPQDDDEATES
jgi:hypothetical protein